MEEHDTIDLRSKAFQDVIGEPPSWLLKWGISAIAAAFIALFVVGYFLEYPETVSASIKLETTNPPIEIGAQTIGNITYFFPEDSIIEKGAILARISDNNGNFNDIVALSEAIAPFSPNNSLLPDLVQYRNTNLGLLEPDLLEYLKLFNGRDLSTEIITNQTFNDYDQDIAKLKQDIDNLQKRIQANEAEIKEIPGQRASYKKAFTESFAASASDFEKDSLNVNYQALIRTLARNEKALQTEILTFQSQIDQNRRAISDRQKAKTNLQSSVGASRYNKKADLAVSFSTLKNKLSEWNAKHIIKAPIQGTVIHQGKLKAKEYFVNVGDKLFAIVPLGAKDSIEGKLFLPSTEATKIKVGQTVKISFNAYRPSEYGLLTGIVTDKGAYPKNGFYQITVGLENKMKTSKNKIIPFEHKMQGEAQIITEDRRFTGIIFDQFREMLGR